AAKMFKAAARFIPPPEGVAPPVLWGDEATVRNRLGSGTSEIRTTRRPFDMDFPFAPADTVQLFRNYFGPVQVAFSRLDPDKPGEYAAGLERLWRQDNVGTGDRTLVHMDYREVIATRA